MEFDYSVCNEKHCKIEFRDGRWVLSGDGFEVEGPYPRKLSESALNAGARSVAHDYDLKLDTEFT